MLNQKLILPRLLGVLLIILIVGGCSYYEMVQGTYVGPVIGSWKFQESSLGPHVLTFRRDQSYELDYNGDGRKDIWGEYEIFNDRIAFKGEMGDRAERCAMHGFYLFKIKRGTMSFDNYADHCTVRSDTLTTDWQRVKDSETLRKYRKPMDISKRRIWRSLLGNPK